MTYNLATKISAENVVENMQKLTFELLDQVWYLIDSHNQEQFKCNVCAKFGRKKCEKDAKGREEKRRETDLLVIKSK